MKNIFFKKAIFLLPILFLKLQSGFVGETLVKTPQGYQEIKQLKIGNVVYGINKDGDLSATKITHAFSYKSKKYLQINFDNQEIIVQQSQKFLLPLQHVWRKTKKLHEKDEVLDAWYRSIKVTVVHQDKNEKTFYDIRLKKDHAFLVTDADIIVHNCPLFMIGIAISWAGCCFTVETIWAGCCVAGLWLGSKLIPKSRRIEPFAKPLFEENNNHQALHSEYFDISYENKKPELPILLPVNLPTIYTESKGECNYPPSQHAPETSCGSATCNPPRVGPNGCHIPSSKHGARQQGNIAPGLGTQDGQEALDNSVPVVGKNEKKKKSRVSVWDGKYIVFDETRKGIFHNHIRPWDNKDGLKGLEKEMKDALIAEGFVENTKGKIKKDAKKSK